MDIRGRAVVLGWESCLVLDKSLAEGTNKIFQHTVEDVSEKMRPMGFEPMLTIVKQKSCCRTSYPYILSIER